MKLLILILIPIAIYANPNLKKNCDEESVNFWIMQSKGEDNIVKKKLKNCEFKNEEIVDSMNILKATLLYNDREYTQSIKTIKLSYDNIDKHYHSKEKMLKKDNCANNIDAIYFLMLSILAESYYYSQEYREAMKIYKKGNASAKKRGLKTTAETLEFIASTYLFLEEYNNALIYFKKAYHASKSQERKLWVSFVIASIYAEKQDLEKTLHWLKEPLTTKRKEYQEKIQGSNFFDNFINNNAFRKSIGLNPIDTKSKNRSK